jgi:glycine/D-amino acid oxidase-like deaminating enzyme
VWEDTVSTEDLAALDPGIPESWDAAPDVLVVGGGVIGLAVAASCTRLGMRVVLIEQGRIAGGPSGRAAGGLSPDAHPEHGEAWHELARASLAQHRELDAAWEYGLRTLDLVIPPDFRIPDQAHVDPLRLAAAFVRRAGTVVTGVSCTASDARDGRVDRVRTSKGDLTPGSVVFATGTAPPQARQGSDTWIKGHLIATEPAPFELRDMVAADILVIQLADGRLIVGGTRDYGDESERIDAEVVSRIEARLAELVPDAAGLRRTHTWCCFRPCCSDELPVIDLVPGLDNAWMVTGLFTTGLLLAPVVGSLLSEWIAGRRPESLGPFSVERAVST